MDRPGSSESVELTPAVLQRVQEGVAAACHPQVRAYTQAALEAIGAVARGKGDTRISGGVRHWILRRFILTLFQVRVEQSDYIPRQPVILVANHLSHLDPFLILATVPQRPYYYILGDARTLFNKRWKRWIVGKAGGVIPLERWWKEEIAVIHQAHHARPDLKDLAQTITHTVPNGSSIQQLRQIDQAITALLKRGDSILLFPEGRLGSQEGQLQTPLKRGTVIYAIRSGVPIVPVAITGTQNLYLGKSLTLRFGKPIPCPQHSRPKRPIINATLAQLEQALFELLPINYQEPEGIKLLQGWLNQLFW